MYMLRNVANESVSLMKCNHSTSELILTKFGKKNHLPLDKSKMAGKDVSKLLVYKHTKAVVLQLARMT